MRIQSMKILPFRAAIIATTLLLAVLAGCRTSPTPQETASQERQVGARGGRLVVADRGTPKTFNSLLAGDSVSAVVAGYLLASPLVELDHDLPDARYLALGRETGDLERLGAEHRQGERCADK